MTEHHDTNDTDDVVTELCNPSDADKEKYEKIKAAKKIEIIEFVKQIFDNRSMLKSNSRLIEDKKLREALRDLPGAVRIYRNYQIYLRHMKSNKNFIPGVRVNIERMFDGSHAFVDRERVEFKKNFAGTYNESMFELVAADFLRYSGIGFSLIEREQNDSGRDFSFMVGGDRYYFECTTINKTCLSEFIHSFHKMDIYLEIAKIIKGRVTPTYADWTQYISKIFSVMVRPLFEQVLEEFKKITQLDDGDELIDISKDANNVHLQAFIRWVGCAKDVVRMYPWALPQEVIEKLQTIDINAGSFPNSERDMSRVWFFDDLVRATARSILGKVTAKHKKLDSPHILFISLANASIEYSGYMMTGYKDFIDYFYETLISHINEAKASYDPKLVTDGLANLYGVIIDTAHVNWFPDNLISNMPVGYNNCFSVFYNQSMSNEMLEKSKPKLFNGMMPDQRQLFFDVRYSIIS